MKQVQNMCHSVISADEWKIFTSNHKYQSTCLGTKADEEWCGDFYFVQGADPQFGMNDAYFNPRYDFTKADWTFEIELAKRAVKKVNTMIPKPRFFIVCGDLTNEFPELSEDLKNRQIEDFKKVFNQTDHSVPLICVCGNHDVGNTPTGDSIKKYHSNFGDDYFSFWCGGVFFIVLNSQLFKNPKYVQEMAEEQERWLDGQLKEAAGKRIICFCHIPWFVNKIDENENIYNIPFETRSRLLEKLHNAGVRYFFCGHCHRNGGGYYKDLELVITSAIGKQLGDDGSGFRIVNVSKEEVTHNYVTLD